MTSLLFVCTGNTCRSPMAEHLFRKMLREARRDDVRVRSSGVAASSLMEIPDSVVRLMRAEGIDISHHRPQPLTAGLVAEADVILTMDQSHRVIIEALYPEARSKTFLLKAYVQATGVGGGDTGVGGGDTGVGGGDKETVDIQDPIGQSDESYRQCFQEIADCLKRLQSRLPNRSQTSSSKETMP